MANLPFKVFFLRASTVLSFRPKFKIVSIIPGIEILAPDLTDTSNGFLRSPNFFLVFFSIFFNSASISLITFVGKLNESNGYDIYKDAVTKILNEFNDWKAYSIVDESRTRPIINHNNHVELGFLKHKKVLQFLNKSEIAVVPSRWEEPFGRTALESSSRGCETIISNRGGLTETTNNSIILKKILIFLNTFSIVKLILQLREI